VYGRSTRIQHASALCGMTSVHSTPSPRVKGRLQFDATVNSVYVWLMRKCRQAFFRQHFLFDRNVYGRSTRIQHAASALCGMTSVHRTPSPRVNGRLSFDATVNSEYVLSMRKSRQAFLQPTFSSWTQCVRKID